MPAPWAGANRLCDSSDRLFIAARSVKAPRAGRASHGFGVAVCVVCLFCVNAASHLQRVTPRRARCVKGGWYF